MNTTTPLMTGKLVFRVDDNMVVLRTWNAELSRYERTGTKQADLEITIDLDALRAQLVSGAMYAKACRASRVEGSIVAKPIKGSVKIHGSGRP